MRLEQLDFFVEVSRSRSFSHAASHLFMSQQNVSTAIAKLEAELGFQLFERTHHGVVLTPQGIEALIKAEEILERVRDLKSIGQTAEKQLTGELRVELVPYIALPEMIVDFYRRNPAISIKTTERAPADIIADLHEGTADVGFMYLRKEELPRRVELLDTPGLEQEKLSQDQLYFCVSKKLKYPHRSYTIQELFEKRVPLVVFENLYDWAMETFEMIQVKNPLVYRVDVHVYKKMIQEGLAAGFATKTGLDQEIIFKKGEIDTLKIRGASLIVCMLYKKEPMSPMKEDFLSIIREKFQELHSEEA
ncbi:MAG: LysR family transcriptional regulator [Coriobacteriia bacterium]|nr:LysR family transcriptional regulator [Coriobacteriia bacterium]